MKTLSTALATATLAVLLTATPAQSAGTQPPAKPSSVVLFTGNGPGTVKIGWFPPRRTGSHPIRRYVVKWDGGSLSVAAKAKNNQVPVTGLDTGRYIFKVKAVSRAGSSGWALSQAVYVA